MLRIYPIPAFNDNYIWAIQVGQKPAVYIVDPGDANPVEAWLQQHQLRLTGILVTHHHYDHTDGIAQLVKKRDIPVYGPEQSSPLINVPLNGQSEVSLDGICFQILQTPGHTLDHIAYFSETFDPVLFCGDTLFGGGCGRLFEGTPEQMHRSLVQIASLPDSTQVFCAHEYTLANLRFCAAVEPNNTALQARIAADTSLRQQNKPTIPSTLAQELATNPFLRCHKPSVIAAAETFSQSNLDDPAHVLRVIRAWKDNF